MELPERFNYTEAYLTFRCNQGCSYCINKSGELKPREEMSGDDWVSSLNGISTDLPITLGGGEPTLHEDFFQIVQETEHPVDLLTNMSFDTEEFIKKVDPERFSKSDKKHYHPIRASYHAETMDRANLLSKTKRLKNAGFNIGIFGIRHPFALTDNMAMAFDCTEAGVPFYEKDFLGEVDGRTYGFYKYPEGIDGERKIADCRTRELLVAPDGLVHRCHRDLYAGENPVADIKDPTSEVVDEFRGCSEYGNCNPCDVKLKTNRYLKEIECQVEIK